MFSGELLSAVLSCGNSLPLTGIPDLHDNVDVLASRLMWKDTKEGICGV